MNVFENKQYQEDLALISAIELPWEKLYNRSILISGASGLIGSFLVDVIMYKNQKEGLNCTINALGRDERKVRERFAYCYNTDPFNFYACDINEPIFNKKLGGIDYVLHLASNTHPFQYSTDPIGTITTNIIGIKNLLDFAVDCKAKRMVFASSNEIYGENRGDVEVFEEDYCGYIDCNTMRAGYPESKRCGEALCQAYLHQKGLDIVIPRFTRSYGPTMLMSDTKAISQFFKKAIAGEDITLKSAGNQYYSYTYVADAVSGLLTVLLKGKTGNAYNIADETSDIRLKDLSALIAKTVGKSVIFKEPDDIEKAGYSVATKARLSGAKVREIGWLPRYDIESGIKRTVQILKEIQKSV
jgi:UDP-glucuronate decarboxylase